MPFDTVYLPLYVNGRSEMHRANRSTQSHMAHKSEVMTKALSPNQYEILKILETWEDQIENMQIPVGTGKN